MTALNSNLNFKSMKIVKDIIRHPYVFPGGYEKVAITSDGGLLCHKCLKECYDTIAHSTLHGINDGFEVVGVDLTNNFEFNTYCDHCNKNLSPYED